MKVDSYSGCEAAPLQPDRPVGLYVESYNGFAAVILGCGLNVEKLLSISLPLTSVECGWYVHWTGPFATTISGSGLKVETLVSISFPLTSVACGW